MWLRLLVEHKFKNDPYSAFAFFDRKEKGTVTEDDMLAGLSEIDAQHVQFPLSEFKSWSEIKMQEKKFCLSEFITAFRETEAPPAIDQGKIILDCKDEKGVERIVRIPDTISFSSLLSGLRVAYRRPVTFLYETQVGELHVVKDEASFAVFLKDTLAESIDPQIHVDSFIIDLDESSRELPFLRSKCLPHTKFKHKLAPSENLAAPPSKPVAKALSTPKAKEATREQARVKLSSTMARLRSSARGPATIWDFEARARQIDRLMDDMQCQKNTTPADKKKKLAVAEPDGDAILFEILQAVQDTFASTEQAFKRFDSDGDGLLSEREFVDAVGGSLGLSIPLPAVRAAFRRLDGSRRGAVSYHDFLQRVDAEARARDGDGAEDGSLLAALAAEPKRLMLALEGADGDCDGFIDSTEIQSSLMLLGHRCSTSRIQRLLTALGWSDQGAGRGRVDFRELHRRIVQSRSVQGIHGDGEGGALMTSRRGVGTMRRSERLLELRVREAIRDRYTEARQAFHVFDLDQDGRLSLDEFSRGVGPLVKEDGDIGLEDMTQLFDLLDRDGDGFVGYHEFLECFGVSQDLREAAAVEAKIRETIQKRFVGSVREAFEFMDWDRDGELSYDDVLEGLKKIGLTLTDKQIQVLVAHGDLDGNKSMNFNEFVVKFGLDHHPTGRWIFQPEKPPPEPVVEASEVKLWRSLLPPSKWYGRGGIRSSLLRYASDKNNLLSRSEFSRAMREGLGMKVLTSADVDLLLGNRGSKPWNRDGHLDVDKFTELFVQRNFTRELALYGFLHRDHRWRDLLRELESLDSVGELGEDEDGDNLARLRRTRGGGVGPAELEASLRRQVSVGCITQETKQRIVEKLEIDGVWKEETLSPKNLIQRYMGAVMEIEDILCSHWEKCVESMSAVCGGEGTLVYKDLHQIMRNLPTEIGITTAQVDILIDSLDLHGKGYVHIDEFTQRFAGPGELLRRAVQKQWKPILAILRSHAPTQPAASPLPIPNLLQGLLHCHDEGLLSTLSREQVELSVKLYPRDLYDSKGSCLYEIWVHRLAGDNFVVHKAFQDISSSSRLPVWDGVIAALELVDEPWGFASCTSGQVRRADFARALVRAGVTLDQRLLSNMLEWLDPDLTGMVDWLSLVRGERGAPYFLDGREHYDVRNFFRRRWLAISRVLEESAGDRLQLSHVEVMGCLEKVLRQFLPISELKTITARISDLMRAFQVDPSATGPKAMVNWSQFLLNFASGAAEAARAVRCGWEKLWLELGCSWGCLDSCLLRETLIGQKFGLSPASVDCLICEVQQKESGEGSHEEIISVEDFCWWAAKDDISAQLMTDEADGGCMGLTLLHACRHADILATGALPSVDFICIFSTRGGLTILQTELLMRRIATTERGVPYRELLLGSLRLEGLKYDGRMCRGWVSLEELWQDIVERFYAFDVDFDMQVSQREFAEGLRKMGRVDLSDPQVNQRLARVLVGGSDESIPLDQLVWTVAKPSLASMVSPIAAQVCEEFRRALGDGRERMGRAEAVETVKRQLAGESAEMHARLVVNKALQLGGSKVGDVTAADLEAAVQWLVAEVRDGEEDAGRLWGALSELMVELLEPLEDTWAESDQAEDESAGCRHDDGDKAAGSWTRRRARRNYAGLCLLGPQALSHVHGQPLPRWHVFPPSAAGGNAVVTPVGGGEALAALAALRRNGVYSSPAWRDFWEGKGKLAEPEDEAKEEAGGGPSEEELWRALALSVSSCGELEEAFERLDPGARGSVALAHAVGLLANLPTCPAWPRTHAVRRLLAPHARRRPAYAGVGGSRRAGSTAGGESGGEEVWEVDYRELLREASRRAADMVGADVRRRREAGRTPAYRPTAAAVAWRSSGR